MKVELLGNGGLIVTAENGLEAYALKHWWSEYLRGITGQVDCESYFQMRFGSFENENM